MGFCFSKRALCRERPGHPLRPRQPLSWEVPGEQAAGATPRAALMLGGRLSVSDVGEGPGWVRGTRDIPGGRYCDPHKGFGIVNKAEIDVFLELSCLFHDPVDWKFLTVSNINCSSSLSHMFSGALSNSWLPLLHRAGGGCLTGISHQSSLCWGAGGGSLEQQLSRWILSKVAVNLEKGSIVRKKH